MAQALRGPGEYGSFAEEYNEGRPSFPQWIFDQIVKLAETPSLQERGLVNVLDVGCGTGVATRQLYQNGFKRLIGMDRDSRMIAVANRHKQPSSQIVYLTAPAEEMPFADETFDIVTTFGSLYWFGQEPGWSFDLERVMKRRALFVAADEKLLDLSPEYVNIVQTYAPYRTAAAVEPNSLESILFRSRLEYLRPETGGYLAHRESAVVFSVDQMFRYYMTGSSRSLISPRRIEAFKRDVLEFCKRQADDHGRIPCRFTHSVHFARAY